MNSCDIQFKIDILCSRFWCQIYFGALIYNRALSRSVFLNLSLSVLLRLSLTSSVLSLFHVKTKVLSVPCSHRTSCSDPYQTSCLFHKRIAGTYWDCCYHSKFRWHRFMWLYQSKWWSVAISYSLKLQYDSPFSVWNKFCKCCTANYETFPSIPELQ